MIDIKLIRENRDLVKENIKKKFQDEKLPLVDEIYNLDIEYRDTKLKMDEMRAEKNRISAEIGSLMRDKKIDEANEAKAKVSEMGEEIDTLTKDIKDKMMIIPQIVHETVPVGKDDSENVEVERFGDPVVPEYEIPYHADIIDRVNGMDKDAAGRTSGQGFYFLLGDIARLHEAMLAYARDYMIHNGFTYAIAYKE